MCRRPDHSRFGRSLTVAACRPAVDVIRQIENRQPWARGQLIRRRISRPLACGRGSPERSPQRCYLPLAGGSPGGRAGSGKMPSCHHDVGAGDISASSPRPRLRRVDLAGGGAGGFGAAAARAASCAFTSSSSARSARNSAANRASSRFIEPSPGGVCDQRWSRLRPRRGPSCTRPSADDRSRLDTTDYCSTVYAGWQFW